VNYCATVCRLMRDIGLKLQRLVSTNRLVWT
jgi:hypothetical protein